jgi:hypothetical protein
MQQINHRINISTLYKRMKHSPLINDFFNKKLAIIVCEKRHKFGHHVASVPPNDLTFILKRTPLFNNYMNVKVWHHEEHALMYHLW